MKQLSFMQLFFALSIAIFLTSLHPHEASTHTKEISIQCDIPQNTLSLDFKLKVEDLSLYRILKIIEQNIQDSCEKKEEIDENSHNNQYRQNMHELCLFIQKNILLLEHIVKEVFNQGAFAHNPEIAYKFVTAYSSLDPSTDILPRHLRVARSKIIGLNKYIQNYCKKNNKKLTQTTISHLNMIAQLNYSMLDYILKDGLMGIDYWDKVVDTIVFKPYEWTKKNKGVVLLGTILIVAIMSYFYLYPQYQRWYYSNSNQNYNIEQLIAAYQPTTNSGIASLYNAQILFQNRNAQQTEAIACDIEALQQFMENNNMRGANDAGAILNISAQALPIQVRNQLLIIPDSTILQNQNLTRENFAQSLDRSFQNIDTNNKLGRFQIGNIPILWVLNNAEDINNPDWITMHTTNNSETGINTRIMSSTGLNVTNSLTVNLIMQFLTRLINPQGD